jgi:hypothetical protein
MSPVIIRKTDLISLAEGERRLGCGRPALMNLIAKGRLTCREIPGSKPMLLASEVDAMAEASTRRAVVTAHDET